MSLRDLCDVAYLIQVDALERHMVAVSAALIAAGADALTLPGETRAEFDAALAAAPIPLSASAVLARRLGVA